MDLAELIAQTREEGYEGINAEAKVISTFLD